MFRSIKSVLFCLVLFITFSSCEKEMSLENGEPLTSGGTQSGTAEFTLDGSVVACTTPTISGTYVAGTPSGTEDSVVITVNVTTEGSYTISTAVINGISFTGSGTFITTGEQAISLYASGTPLVAASSLYIPGTNGCPFIVTVTPAIVIPVGADYLTCKIDGELKTFNFAASAIKYPDTLSIGGLTANGSNEVIEIQIIGTNTPAVGTYEAEGVVTSPSGFVEAVYYGPSGEIFFISIIAPTPRPNPFKVVVSSISSTRIKGTFQGGMFDAGGSTVQKIFTEGSFDLPVQ